MTPKEILFLTGTRADFGKLKSLIHMCEEIEDFNIHVFVTGMHMKKLYGSTVDEVIKSGFKNIFKFINHDHIDHMDRILAKTVDGLSHYISDNPVDLIIVHGDRVEALAGSIVGSLNNILVAHIEGGELSGTIDESIRHAVTKMSHIHLVSNQKAKSRLLQLGECDSSIHIIGSPDLDLMFSADLPKLDFVKNHYEIEYDDYSIAMYHPVTTEIDEAKVNAENFVNALIESDKNYVVIYPNNDIGSNEILTEYEMLRNNSRFKIFPSLRFEYFLVLLKHSNLIIGNSSAAVREAPYYGVPSVNIGSRQNNRVKFPSIIDSEHDTLSILEAIKSTHQLEIKDFKKFDIFGLGNSSEMFKKILLSHSFWNTKKQKHFQEI